MSVDVLIKAEPWAAAGLSDLAPRAFDAVTAHFGWPKEHYSLAVLGCDDARVAALNRDFRGKDQPTNVLSWPSVALDQPVPVPDWNELGDLALAYQTCAQEAKAQDKSFDAHVLHLLVHGILHLLGYDHVTSADAELMEETEILILAKIGVANPY